MRVSMIWKSSNSVALGFNFEWARIGRLCMHLLAWIVGTSFLMEARLELWTPNTDRALLLEYNHVLSRLAAPLPPHLVHAFLKRWDALSIAHVAAVLSVALRSQPHVANGACVVRS